MWSLLPFLARKNEGAAHRYQRFRYSKPNKAKLRHKGIQLLRIHLKVTASSWSRDQNSFPTRIAEKWLRPGFDYRKEPQNRQADTGLIKTTPTINAKLLVAEVGSQGKV